jgi:hypothetical protein
MMAFKLALKYVIERALLIRLKIMLVSLTLLDVDKYGYISLYNEIVTINDVIEILQKILVQKPIGKLILINCIDVPTDLES